MKTAFAFIALFGSIILSMALTSKQAKADDSSWTWNDGGITAADDWEVRT